MEMPAPCYSGLHDSSLQPGMQDVQVVLQNYYIVKAKFQVNQTVYLKL
jgi:hypothetical protein